MYNFQVGDRFYWNGNYNRASYKEAIAEVIKVEYNIVYWIWYIDGKETMETSAKIDTMTDTVELGRWIPLQPQNNIIEFNDPEYETMLI